MSNYTPFEFSVEVPSGLAEEIEETALFRARRSLTRVGQMLVDRIQEELDQRGTGKIYPSKAGHGWHQASSPGEPPAPDTRRYLESWAFSIIRSGREIGLRVTSSLWDKFGRRLELGGSSPTPDGGSVYIAPRPHVRPVFDRSIAEIEETIEGLE